MTEIHPGWEDMPKTTPATNTTSTRKESTMEEILVPARHLHTGDHVWGYVVSEIRRFPGIDGVTTHHLEFKFVVPFTTHSMTVTVQAKDENGILFPVTKRGDDHNPNPRNALLGLPLTPPKQYVTPQPIAVYPAGTEMSDVKHFDRSMKVLFHCPNHPEAVYASKDPYVSNWFSAAGSGVCNCHIPTGDYIVHEDYKPTRDG